MTTWSKQYHNLVSSIENFVETGKDVNGPFRDPMVKILADMKAQEDYIANRALVAEGKRYSYNRIYSILETGISCYPNI